MKDDLISRKAALELLGEPHPLDHNAIADVQKIIALPAVEAVPMDNLCAILEEAYTTPLCWKCEKALGEEYCIEKECGCGSKEHWKAYFEKLMEASKNDAE